MASQSHQHHGKAHVQPTIQPLTLVETVEELKKNPVSVVGPKFLVVDINTRNYLPYLRHIFSQYEFTITVRDTLQVSRKTSVPA